MIRTFFSSLILFLFLVVSSVIFPVDAGAAGSNPSCLGISGKFTAVNWPSGQTIDVACAGDTGTAGCRGEKVTLKPGQSYDFNNCTCAPWGTQGDSQNGLKGGCVFVGKSLRISQQSNGNRIVLGDTSLPAGCTLKGGNPIACGSNGQVVKQPFTIVCKGPTLTVTKKPTPTRTPTPTGTLTPSPTRTPTPSSCPVPPKAVNVRITCPFCGQ